MKTLLSTLLRRFDDKQFALGRIARVVQCFLIFRTVVAGFRIRDGRELGHNIAWPFLPLKLHIATTAGNETPAVFRNRRTS